jgi:hypothetical protein
LQDLRTFYEEQQIIFQQKERDLADVVSETPPDDIVENSPHETSGHQETSDGMMVDIIAQQEEMDLEALLASYQEAKQTAAEPTFPPEAQSPPYSDGDDYDYDELFMDLLPDAPTSLQPDEDHMDTGGS